MRRQRSRNTTPELRLRRALHARGRRFRVIYPMPGMPRRSIDIAFTRQKVAVFVDGCFWHSCLEHGTQPATDREWWKAKLERTVARDRETDDALVALGWTVLRIWEHAPPEEALALVEECLQRHPGAAT
jgi:DNA mismatch endonuclease (patch repair protein)